MRKGVEEGCAKLDNLLKLWILDPLVRWFCFQYSSEICNASRCDSREMHLGSLNGE